MILSMAEFLLSPEIIVAIVTFTMLAGGWFTRNVLGQLLTGWVYAPVKTQLDAMESRINRKIEHETNLLRDDMTFVKQEIGHLRDNGDAFADRVTGIERRVSGLDSRLNQGDAERHELRRQVSESLRLASDRLRHPGPDGGKT